MPSDLQAFCSSKLAGFGSGCAAVPLPGVSASESPALPFVRAYGIACTLVKVPVAGEFVAPEATARPMEMLLAIVRLFLPTTAVQAFPSAD